MLKYTHNNKTLYESKQKSMALRIFLPSIWFVFAGAFWTVCYLELDGITHNSLALHEKL
jgi:hypothetical protein